MLYTLPQAAMLIGVSHQTIRVWVQKGRFKGVTRINGATVIPYSEVQRVRAEAGHSLLLREAQLRRFLEVCP